jgi:hypothetical protein
LPPRPGWATLTEPTPTRLDLKPGGGDLGGGTSDVATPAPPPARRRSLPRRLLVGCLPILLLVLAILAGWLIWYLQPQPLLPEATAALQSTPEVVVSTADDGRLTFTPTSVAPTTDAPDAPLTGLILYPGGKVPPAAYAPAARDIAAAGHLVVIAPMPFNLAVFGIDAADHVIADHPAVERWAIGGHSLGGSMAAQYNDTHPDVIDALAMWASYSAADLSDDDLLVTSSYGSLDNGRESFTSPVNIERLGPDLVLDEIDGGNHEQMGWYTGQPNDPSAAIPREAQQARIVAATIALLDRLAR